MFSIRGKTKLKISTIIHNKILTANGSWNNFQSRNFSHDRMNFCQKSNYDRSHGEKIADRHSSSIEYKFLKYLCRRRKLDAVIWEKGQFAVASKKNLRHGCSVKCISIFGADTGKLKWKIVSNRNAPVWEVSDTSALRL